MTAPVLARRALVLVLLVALASGSGSPSASARVAPVGRTDVPSAVEDARGAWQWPVSPPRIARAFVAPAHEYGPGHRGIDLEAGLDAPVRAPQSGTVAFAGSVAGRGIVTIDHGDGLVTTLEPVTAVVAIGDAVRAGDVVASVALGGHATPGTLHFGVREDGEYINPALLFGAVPRAVLLPCC